MKIIFLGTPEFSVPSLDILYQAGYQIPAVITSPDRRGGRGRNKIIQSAIKKYALAKGIKVLQPTNLKSPKFNAELKSLQAELQIVVAFRMLPEAVWDMPPLGTYNLHGSLLPQYRGAAPINWSIINGDKETGVTSFKLKHEIDTGSLLLQQKIPIYNFDNAGDLHDRMKWIAADTVLESVKIIESGQINLIPQDNSKVSHAPKLTSNNTQINFQDKAENIINLVRGLAPYPGAWMELDGKITKIFECHQPKENSQLEPGKLKTDGQHYIHIGCKDGCISIQHLQMSGKKAMKVANFLNGYKLLKT